MEYSFKVANVKCGGCASNIKTNLENDARIKKVEVDIESGTVRIDANSDASSDWLKQMADLGYPEKE